MIIDRENWLLIVGPDLSNNHYGISLCWGKLSPIADYRRWRHQWRINVRLPITFRHTARKA